MDVPVTAKAALLQALVRGPGYGLDLIERVKKQTNGKLVLGQGSVYPALRELERERLLETYEGEPLPERGGRPRRYYRLNALGVKAAMEQR
jgi:PadR family transcriptional regulator PadR